MMPLLVKVKKDDLICHCPIHFVNFLTLFRTYLLTILDTLEAGFVTITSYLNTISHEYWNYYLHPYYLVSQTINFLSVHQY